MPRARNTINRGIGFLTLGILTTIWLLVYVDVGATIRTDNVLSGLEASSDTVLISAPWL